MTRRTVVAITLFLILALGAAFGTAEQRVQLSPLSEDERMGSIVSIGADLYILAGKGLYRWTPGEDSPICIADNIAKDPREMKYGIEEDEKALKPHYCVSRLYAHEGMLYGLDASTGLLYTFSLENEKATMETMLALRWLGVQQAFGMETIYVRSMAIFREKLYLLLEDTGSSPKRLYAFDLKKGTGHQVEMDHVTNLGNYKGDALYITLQSQTEYYEGISPTLYSWNPDTDETEVISQIPIVFPQCLAYNQEEDVFCFTAMGQVHRLKDGIWDTAGVLPADGVIYGSHQGAFLPGDLYAALPNYVDLYVFNTAETPEFRTLQVGIPGEFYYDPTLLAYQKATPGTAATYVNYSAMGDQGLQLRMIAGYDDVDIYVIRNMEEYRSLRDKGYTADLSGSDVLTTAAARMYDNMEAELYSEGKLIAFPKSISASVDVISPELFLEAEAQPPETLEDLLLFLPWWEETGYEAVSAELWEGMVKPRLMMFNTIVYHYMIYHDKEGLPLSFDTPLFRRLLTVLDEASPYLESLSTEVVYFSANKLNRADYLMLFGMGLGPEFLGWNWTDLYVPHTMPLCEEIPYVITGSMEMLVVNPFSKNKEMAIEYLEYYAENMPVENAISLYADYSEPVRDVTYHIELERQQQVVEELRQEVENAPPDQKKEMQGYYDKALAELALYENTAYEISPDEIAMYQSLAPEIYFPGPMEDEIRSTPLYNNLVMQYALENTITHDALIAQLDHLVALWMRENGQ